MKSKKTAEIRGGVLFLRLVVERDIKRSHPHIHTHLLYRAHQVHGKCTYIENNKLFSDRR